MTVRVPLLYGGYCELDREDLFTLVYGLSEDLGYVPFPPQALGLVDGVAWNAVARRTTAGFDVFLRELPGPSDVEVRMVDPVPDRLPDEIARLK